jgi:thioredoxin reductase
MATSDAEGIVRRESPDAIVIGGGPAGLSAATWLARYRRTVTVIDAARYRNRRASKLHGYLGSDPVDPMELIDRAMRGLRKYPEVELCRGGVVSATADGDDGFHVATESAVLRARRLVLATGVEDEYPEIDGFWDHYGANVFHCPSCDGYEARGRGVVVFGWSEHVAGFALELKEWATDVIVVTEGRSFDGNGTKRRELERQGVPIIQESATRLVGERGDLRGAILGDGRFIPCANAFFSIAHRPRLDLAAGLGCRLTDEGYVGVDGGQQTSVPGVYAAGDVTPGLQLVQIAAAKGVAAGIACAESLAATRSHGP